MESAHKIKFYQGVTDLYGSEIVPGFESIVNYDGDSEVITQDSCFWMDSEDNVFFFTFAMFQEWYNDGIVIFTGEEEKEPEVLIREFEVID